MPERLCEKVPYHSAADGAPRPTVCVRKANVLLALFLLVPLSGCTTALKQAYYEFRGAEAKLVTVQPADNDAFDAVRSVRFTPPTSTVSPRVVKPATLHAYEMESQYCANMLNRQLPGGEPVLMVDSELMFLQEKGILSSGMLLVRVKMSENGRLVADGISQAETKSFRQAGADDLAEVAADAVAKYIAKQKDIDFEKEENDEAE